jgi:hypothetical protein
MALSREKESQQAHELIDRLAPAQLSAVVGLLKAITDPVSRAITEASVEDDELTPEAAAALDEAREWLKDNPAIPHEDVLAELGFTPEEIERCRKEK